MYTTSLTACMEAAKNTQSDKSNVSAKATMICVYNNV